jgi:predicted RNA binding protein YcfA (HicA-like mRNA interferase family)
MKWRDLERALRWTLERQGSRHEIWRRGDQTIAVPRHAEINERTAKSILKEAGESEP